MAEPIAREVVVAHLDDQRRSERLPFPRALAAPPTGPAGRVAGEAGGLDQRADLVEQGLAGGGGKPGCEAHVVEEPLLIVEAEEQ